MVQAVRITEPSREIDVVHETDVLVIGSGPGGLAAAIAAARAGVSVTLLLRKPALHRCYTACLLHRSWMAGRLPVSSPMSKADREAILAKRVIDATGDADVAYRAGAITKKFRKRK